MGVVALPSRVTGFAAISMSEEITFMPECQGSWNSSQYDLASGVGWRLILNRTVFLLAMLGLPARLEAAVSSDYQIFRMAKTILVPTPPFGGNNRMEVSRRPSTCSQR